MTLVSQIVEDTFRKANFVGEDNYASPRQAKEAVRSLNSMISAIWGGDSGERLTDWPLGNFGRQSTDPLCAPSDCLAHPSINRRLIAVNETALTVYLTGHPQDGSRMGIVDPYARLSLFPVTLDGNGRPIEDSPTLVLDTDGLNREWLYRSDLGSWVRLTDITATDEMPFPPYFDNMFTVMLAVDLAPQFGKQISDILITQMKRQQNEFIARYLQSQPLIIDDSISWPFMSKQSYDTQRTFSSRRAFDRGSYF